MKVSKALKIRLDYHHINPKKIHIDVGQAVPGKGENPLGYSRKRHSG
ncbi:MAG: hypothetical protein JRE29_05825 [Deltaproteobacteria bacterium]|nr:hypothetical protein [Deltaproteobacteria bacterium]